jgi:hypothetical protein
VLKCTTQLNDHTEVQRTEPRNLVKGKSNIPRENPTYQPECDFDHNAHVDLMFVTAIAICSACDNEMRVTVRCMSRHRRLAHCQRLANFAWASTIYHADSHCTHLHSKYLSWFAMHATSAGNLSKLGILLCSIHNKPASCLDHPVRLVSISNWWPILRCFSAGKGKMRVTSLKSKLSPLTYLIVIVLPPGDANDTRVWTFSSIPSVYRHAFVCSPRHPLAQVLHKEATALPKASSQGGVRTCKTLCSLPCLAVRATDYFRQFFWGTPRSFYNPLDQIKIHYQGSILIYISYWRKIKKSGRKIRKDRTPYLRRGPPA